MKKIKVASLFAGIGGFDLAFSNVKINGNSPYEVVWANEIDEYACTTYEQNFNHKLIKGDIEKCLSPELADDKIEFEYYSEMKEIMLEQPIDIITAGFPCQPFSIAGEMKGFEDDRGNLFLSILRLVCLLEQRHHKPRVLFLENVKNLLSHDKGRTYKIIKKSIEDLGYVVKEAILNTSDYTHLPQNRERIFIVCFLNQSDSNKFKMFENLESYKIKKNQSSKISAVSDILNVDEPVDNKYYYSREKYPLYFNEYLDDVENVNLEKEIIEFFQFYQLRRGKYVRKNKSGYCPTLTANMGTGGHNVPLIRDSFGIRKITPSEALRLQGFPLDSNFRLPKIFKGRPYSDANLYKQAGNAVSVPLVELIATNLLPVFIDGLTSEKDIRVSLFD